jgi:hypothetical protein
MIADIAERHGHLVEIAEVIGDLRPIVGDGLRIGGLTGG